MYTNYSQIKATLSQRDLRLCQDSAQAASLTADELAGIRAAFAGDKRIHIPATGPLDNQRARVKAPCLASALYIARKGGHDYFARHARRIDVREALAKRGMEVAPSADSAAEYYSEEAADSLAETLILHRGCCDVALVDASETYTLNGKKIVNPAWQVRLRLTDPRPGESVDSWAFASDRPGNGLH